MNKLDLQLKELYLKILSKNNIKTDRTGINTKSIFCHQMRFDLREGFPLTTLRKIHIKSLIHELLWFLSAYDEKYNKFGNTNIKYLCDMGVTFWTDWPYKEYKLKTIKNARSDINDEVLLSVKEFENKIKTDDNFALEYGNLGPVYGGQFLNWGETLENNGINQIDKLIDSLKNNPDSRRHIVSAWNVSEIDNMLLPPCHILWQCYTELLSDEERMKYAIENYDVEAYTIENKIDINKSKELIYKHFNIPERYIDMHLYQRSNDSYLGIVFNIPSYSLLLTMIGQVVNMIPREFIWTGGDIHLYTNSFEATEELIKREIRSLPKLKVNPHIKNIYDFRYEDFEIVGYDPHPNIKVEVAV